MSASNDVSPSTQVNGKVKIPEAQNFSSDVRG
jgi:hypothetical protein